MADNTMNENLDIIGNSNLEIEYLDGDLNIIQKLDDEPNDVGGLTSQQLKAKFDEGGNLIKRYINEKLIPAILEDDATEAARMAAEEDRENAESFRATEEKKRRNAETARESAETARESAETAREKAEKERVDSTSGIVAKASAYAGEAGECAVAALISASSAEEAADDAENSKQKAAAASNRAEVCAERATYAEEYARSALSGVQAAIKNIPKGSTPIVNDLTTGGSTMALSAEQGKVLGSRTVIHQYMGLTGIGLTDAEMNPENFAANVAAILNALPNKAVVYLSENTTNFCASLRAKLNADLGIAIETAVPRMRLVRFGGNAAPAKLEAIIDSVVYKQIFEAHVDQASGRTELSPFTVAYDSSGFLLNSGGKLSGDLVIEKASPRLILTGADATDVRLSILSGFAVLQARDSQDAAVSRQLRLYTAGKEGDLRHAAAFSSNESGASVIYSLLGVHNKPTGTYTGNSSAEVQEKDVGALGNILLVWNNSLDVVSLVTPRGAICKSGASLSAIGYDECRYSDGVLYLATAAAALNQSGKSYSYRAI